MIKITTAQLQEELTAIDPRLLIVPNQNRPGAANIHLNGADICTWVPAFEVQDEHTPDYVYKLNDTPIPFKTVGEIKEIINNTLAKLQTPEFSDVLFDTPMDVAEETYGQHKA